MLPKLRHLGMVARENGNNDYKTNRHKMVPRDAVGFTQYVKIVVLFFHNLEKILFL